MPGVSSFTPAWLSRPSPGFDFFNGGSTDKSKQAGAPSPGPARTIACRGTEIFAAFGNEIRWSDLVLLRDEWEEAAAGSKKTSVTGAQEQVDSVAYRILKVPVFGAIKQLVLSPSGEYVAILTSHTVHVAILPDSSHLTLGDKTPLKLKAFQVGPSTHVLDQSPVATVLWHPLGAQGNCLVTITVDAVARVWELDRDNRWSFSEPNLAVDLRKLANGSSTSDDFSPSKYGASKGFSADSFEMEVASACFGGVGTEDEGGWASMTLWIAMQEGDIYALCPFLPSKWRTTPTLVSKLSTSILTRSAAMEEDEDPSTDKDERRIASAQYAWIAELHRQSKDATNTDSMVYQQTTHTSPIPKLQGPFSFGDMAEVFQISDIFSIPAVEEGGDFSEQDYASNAEHAALSVNVICVATSDNHVHVCLDVEGVEGCWLPTQKALYHDERANPELLLVKSIPLGPASASAWPVFTADEQSRYSLLTTHEGGVSRISLHDWANKLEEELIGAYETGAEFRIELLVETARVDVEQIIQISRALSDTTPRQRAVAACLNLQDSDLGDFILTTVDRQPLAATLEASNLQYLLQGDGPEDLDDEDVADMFPGEARPTYQPPQELWNESVLGATVQESLQGRHRHVLQDAVRLSPLTLKIVMDAHRILSRETHRMGLAAADLFRRCERLRDEFREQIRRANMVSSRVDSLLDDDDEAAAAAADDDVFSQADEPDDDTEGGGPAGGIEKRLRTAHTRQASLLERCAAIRDKTARLDKHPLSEKEGAWVAEIASMEQLVLEQTRERTDDDDDDDGGAAQVEGPLQRMAEVQRLGTELKARAAELARDAMDVADGDGDAAASSMLSPSRGRRQLEQIFGMLERETALVEASREKLARLGVMTL